MGRHSSGCRTCVRRRVRCDETRPQCLRCLKLGSQCPGYRDPQDLVFVDETDYTRQRHRPAVKGSSTILEQLSTAPEEHSTAVPAQLDLTAYSSVICQSFLLTRFGSTGSSYVDHETNGIWMRTALSRPEKYPLATLCLSALSESFYGRYHHKKNIVMMSFKSYNSAICRLRKALEDGDLRPSYDFLAAIAGLYYYEYLSFTSSRAWLQHTEALSRLLQARGWQAFQMLPESSILESVREPLIAAALVVRKPSFLENEAWKPRSHLHNDILVHHIVELNHVYAQIPRIARDILLLEESPPSSSDPNLVGRTHQDIENIKVALDDWCLTWTENYRQCLRRVASSKLASHISGLGDCLDEIFDFDDLKIAKVFVDYWAISILSFIQTRKLRRLSLDESTDDKFLADSTDAKVRAVNICRSVPYFLQPVHIEAACLYLALPIRVAYLVLSPDAVEAQLLTSWRDWLSDRTGTEMLRNILDNVPMRRAQPGQEHLSQMT